MSLNKNFKQEKAIRSEKTFQELCADRNVDCKKLDGLQALPLRKKFLKNPNGRCPDFICSKENDKILIEVKTLTNFTNAAREKLMKQETVDVFDPLPELKGPLENFLKDASSKFKNVKEEYNYPRIMFLEGVFGASEMIPAVYAGMYHTYTKPAEKLVYVGYRKKHRALLDGTGSNVSAIVWWNNEIKRFEGLENPRARIKLIEKMFSLFFS